MSWIKCTVSVINKWIGRLMDQREILWIVFWEIRGLNSRFKQQWVVPPCSRCTFLSILSLHLLFILSLLSPYRPPPLFLSLLFALYHLPSSSSSPLFNLHPPGTSVLPIHPSLPHSAESASTSLTALKAIPRCERLFVAADTEWYTSFFKHDERGVSTGRYLHRCVIMMR